MRHLTWLALLLSVGSGPAMAQPEPAQSAAPAEASAGTASAGAWSPQDCGAEPARPVLDLSDRAKYNRSADEVNVYESKAKAWDACVTKRAKSDMDAISVAAETRMAGIRREAMQIQTRVYDGFGEYTTQFKTAQERFEKEK